MPEKGAPTYGPQTCSLELELPLELSDDLLEPTWALAWIGTSAQREGRQPGWPAVPAEAMLHREWAQLAPALWPGCHALKG